MISAKSSRDALKAAKKSKDAKWADTTFVMSTADEKVLQKFDYTEATEATADEENM